MAIEWIKVEDRLPPKRMLVIVSGGVGYINDLGVWMTVTGCEYPGKAIMWEVTHWAFCELQPLPDRDPPPSAHSIDTETEDNG